uniref:ATP synthase subunit 8 n=1 Tax=Angaria delphinus TaxID=335739 RepID=A0A1I9SSV0_9VEST|nr:ATP synthase F0 subunit 8 [Angaria delphinus]AOZ71820.1 ATP synthase subunit 8 [Angaria delphinus]
MPQLAPVNWLLLFLFFWFIIGLVSCIIWWSFNSEYKIDSGLTGMNAMGKEDKWAGRIQKSKKSWSW